LQGPSKLIGRHTEKLRNEPSLPTRGSDPGRRVLRVRGVPDLFPFHPADGGYRKPIEAAVLKRLTARACDTGNMAGCCAGK
jgi:hypothetical protein